MDLPTLTPFLCHHICPEVFSFHLLSGLPVFTGGLPVIHSPSCSQRELFAETGTKSHSFKNIGTPTKVWKHTYQTAHSGFWGRGTGKPLNVFYCVVGNVHSDVFFLWFGKDLKCLIWYLHTRGSSSCVRVLDTRKVEQLCLFVMASRGRSCDLRVKRLRKWAVGRVRQAEVLEISVPLASKWCWWPGQVFGLEVGGPCWKWMPGTWVTCPQSPAVLWFHVVHQKTDFVFFFFFFFKPDYRGYLSRVLVTVCFLLFLLSNLY